MIALGYELVTGNLVEIPLRHTAVTGQTQESGKTTTLEALITRSGLRAVAFITKRGEKSFRLQTPIPPYFHEPQLDAETPMWRWVESIFGTLGESVGSDDQALIIQCSRTVLREEKYKVKTESRVRVVEGTQSVTTLAQVAANVALMLKHARGRDRKSLTRLDAYFQIVMPQIARMKASGELKLAEGINVMDLEGLTSEMQMLIIRSVLETVYSERRNTVVIIPEAWKFIPRARTSPVRFAAEIYIRQGLALKNILMLDSQDLANIATEVLKSIGVWILGKQSEINEVKRVVNYIPASPRIPPETIMRLGKGEFYVVAEGKVKKCYVQPAGMEDLHAQAIARGEESADSWKQIERKLDQPRRSEPAQVLQTQTQEEPEDAEDSGAGGAVREDRASGGQGGPAGSGPAVPRGEEDPGGEGGDDMQWKERAELAEAENRDLRLQVDDLKIQLANISSRLGDAPSSSLTREVHHQSFTVRQLSMENGNFAEFVRRLREHPEVIALVAQQPDLRVRVDRPVVEMDGSTTIGRVAILIHQGFFNSPTNSASVLREFKARGWIREKAGYAELIKPMKEITEMGFLRVESGSYQTVPGMKIHEAKA